MNQIKKKAEQALQEGMLLAADQLDSIMQNLSASTEQLYHQVEEARNGAQTQSERITETATAIDQNERDRIGSGQKRFRRGPPTPRKRVPRPGEGAEIVNDVAGAISGIEKRVQDMQQDVNGLGQQAEGIGQIMNVITDIADQTNLLALNAAIEARAGRAMQAGALLWLPMKYASLRKKPCPRQKRWATPLLPSRTVPETISATWTSVVGGGDQGGCFGEGLRAWPWKALFRSPKAPRCRSAPSRPRSTEQFCGQRRNSQAY